MVTPVGDFPTHWFRMKAYDIATEFGLSSVQRFVALYECHTTVGRVWCLVHVI